MRPMAAVCLYPAGGLLLVSPPLASTFQAGGGDGGAAGGTWLTCRGCCSSHSTTCFRAPPPDPGSSSQRGTAHSCPGTPRCWGTPNFPFRSDGVGQQLPVASHSVLLFERERGLPVHVRATPFLQGRPKGCRLCHRGGTLTSPRGGEWAR